MGPAADFSFCVICYLAKFFSWVSITFCWIETLSKHPPISLLEPKNANKCGNNEY